MDKPKFIPSIANFIEPAICAIWDHVKKPARRFPLLVVLVVVFAASFFILLFHHSKTQSTTQCPGENKQVLASETQKENLTVPVRLKIPNLNVDATIESVGLTAKGAMGVPNNTANVGWFYLGPRPGENGSAVIAGHFNKENGEPGVFANLYTLKKGDKLFVEDNRGMSVVFVVQEIRNHDSEYADEVFTRNDKAYLNLVTCEGIWDEVKKSYSKRLVVFADVAN